MDFSTSCADHGMISGLDVGLVDQKLTRLQFADDTLVFCKADVDEIKAIKRLLKGFEAISGLRINYHKTVLCGQWNRGNGIECLCPSSEV